MNNNYTKTAVFWPIYRAQKSSNSYTAVKLMLLCFCLLSQGILSAKNTSAAWQITNTRLDSSPQPSGFQINFRLQLQCSALDENACYNSEVRFPAQAPTTFSLPAAHPAIESFYFDALTDEWVVDLQDVIFAGTTLEFDITASSPNHTTPDGSTFQIDATVDSDNADPVTASASGAWSASANLGVEKYLQYGPDTDALLDIPIR